MSKSKERLIMEAIIRANASFYSPGRVPNPAPWSPNINGYYHDWVLTGSGSNSRYVYEQRYFGTANVAMGPKAFDDTDFLRGGEGNDVLWGGRGADTLSGGEGNDVLIGGRGSDKDMLIGMQGNDFLLAGDLNYGVSEGNGSNFLALWKNWLSGKQNLSDAELKSLFVYSDTGAYLNGGWDNDTLIGGNGDDELNGGRESDLIYGGRGNDKIDGDVGGEEPELHGNDTLYGEEGDDEIYGWGGDDILDGGADNDKLYGGDGNDTLIGGSGNNEIDGGDGFDIVSYASMDYGVTVDLGAGQENGYIRVIRNQANEYDDIKNIEGVIGSAYSDIISGDNSDNYFNGGGGADKIDGRGGNDTLSFAGAQSGVWASMATGNAHLADNSSLGTFENIEVLEGSDYNDTLIGDDANNHIAGGAGNDSLMGGAGSDTIVSGLGYDYIDGGDGDDWVDYSQSNGAVNINLTAGTAIGGHAYGDTLVSIENVIGSKYNDSIQAGNSGSKVYGGAGNDLLISGAGADYLDGGDGIDTVSYASSDSGVSINLETGQSSGGYAQGDTLVGIEYIEGSAHNDTMIGSSGNDTLIGGAGDDYISGGAGDDLIFGGSGADTIDGGDGIDTISYANSDSALLLDLSGGASQGAEAEGDVLSNIEVIEGSKFNDTIIAGNAASTIRGGAGDDILKSGQGADYLDGGSGNDIADYSLSDAGVYVSLRTGKNHGGYAEGDTLVGIEKVVGSNFDDTLVGTAWQDNLSGGAGNDYIEGNGGGDYIDGGDGFDIVSYENASSGIKIDRFQNTIGGAAAQDTLVSIEGFVGTKFNDQFVASAGADYFDGGEGLDSISYKNSDAGITLNLVTGEGSGGHAEGDTIRGMEYIYGSSYDDRFIMSDNYKEERIEAGAGKDTIDFSQVSAGVNARPASSYGAEVIIGSNYNDILSANNISSTIFGGAGDDFVSAYSGNNYIDGGEGFDSISYQYASNAGVNVNLATGVASGGIGIRDTLAGFEAVFGSSYNDTITGNAEDNYLDGGNGNDSLSGGAGNDTLVGGVGYDTLDGGAGFDIADYTNSNAAINVNLATGIITGGHATGDKLISIEGIAGSKFNDTMIGGAGNDYFNGGAGNDSFQGSLGADTLIGGEGIDTLSYENSNAGVNVNLATGEGRGGHAEGDVLSGFEFVIGSAHNDTIIGSAENEFIIGGAGADYLDGGAGIDSISYANSNAGVNVNLATGQASGGHAQGDTVLGFEQILGSNYNDTIAGIDGSETIDGGSGNDYIYGSAGADSLVGGYGIDTLDYSQSDAGVNVDLNMTSASGGHAHGDRIYGFEVLVGSAFNDTLIGTNSADTLMGGAGDDYLDGGLGHDSLVGGMGNDTLAGGLGNDTLDGGEGFDIADYTNSNANIHINLATGLFTGGHAAGDKLISIEGIVGSKHNDTLIGGSGNDYLDGGAGNDSFQGSLGADTLIGGEGIDTLSYENSNAGVNVNLATGEGRGGHAEGDVLSGFEFVIGSAHNDTIIGSAENEFIIGGAGADYLDGGAGIDTLSYATSNAGVNVNLATGQASGGHAQGDTVLGFEQIIGSIYNDTIVGIDGSETINGGVGNDYIYGSAGADSLVGGYGTDTLDYSQSDAGVNVNLTTSQVSGGYAQGDTIVEFEAVVGSAFNDILVGFKLSDTLMGGAGNDTLVGSSGSDVLDGGEGFDIADYTNSNSNIHINLATGLSTGGDAAGDKLISIEGIVGSRYNDTLIANNSGNYLDGGNGYDLIVGGAGADTLIGGEGIDTLSYENSNAGVNVNLAAGENSGGHAEGDVISGFEVVFGSAFNDTIIGTDANNSIVGGAGADYLDGGAGIDFISYAASNAGVNVNLATGQSSGGHAQGDTVLGFEQIIGSNYNDTIAGTDGSETIDGGAGDDYIYGSAGADSLVGGAGIDTLDYSQSDAGVNVDLTASKVFGGHAQGDTIIGFEAVVGSAFNDTLVGSRFSDTLVGGAGDDYLDGGFGNDSIFGGAGNDTLVGGYDNDTLDGGAGFDIADYTNSSSGIHINLATGVTSGGHAAGDKLISIEGIVGSRHSDTLIANDSGNYLDGGNGYDLIVGGAGADTLIGGDGIDTLSYENSNAGVNVNLANGENSGGHAEGDVISGFEVVFGSAFNDTIIGTDANNTIIGGAGADYLDGGAGIDSVSYANSNAGVNVNLATGQASGGHAQGDTVLGFEQIIGSNYNDTIAGIDGSETIDGGAGDDYIYGSAGADSLVGGAGIDTLDYSQSDAGVNVNLGRSQVFGGHAQGDTINGFEVVIGSAYDDTITGSSYADTISGGDGNDYINGYGGNDSLFGGAGDDTFVGSSGRTTFNGGDGSDIVDYSGYAGKLDINLATNVNKEGASGHVFVSIEGVLAGYKDDIIIGNSADNYIDGGAGNDFIAGGAGADTLIGGAGIDTLSYEESGVGVNVNLATGAISGGDAEGDIISGFEVIIGSSHNDTIIGSDANEIIIGGAGADYLDGGAGNDTLSYVTSSAAVNINLATGEFHGGDAEGDTISGFEQIVGSNYDDTFIGSAGGEMVDGGAGNDYFYGSAGADTLVGGDGKDTIDYSQSDAGICLDMSGGIGVGGYAEGDRLSGFEALIGSGYSDTIYGSLTNDTIYGGAGNDIIYSSRGNDYINGGDGFDTVNYSQRAGNYGVSVDLSSSWNDGDTLVSIEGVIGTRFSDALTGNAEANYLDGGAGDDKLRGGAGNDTLVGGLGRDFIDGGEGFDIASYATSSSAISVNLASLTGSAGDAYGDTLISIEGVIGSRYNDNISGNAEGNYLFGGLGNDSLTGGLGADTFGYVQSDSGQDLITDFCSNDGDIILIETTNGTGSVSVTDGPALTSGSQGCFNGNDVLVVRGDVDSYVYIDSDGDGNFNSSLDQTICLKNTLDISENNILFTNKLIG